MQRTNGMSIQRVIFIICAALSFVLTVSYLYSDKTAGSAAHAAGIVVWTILAIGGANDNRPKWFNVAAIPAVLIFLALTAFWAWPRA